LDAKGKQGDVKMTETQISRQSVNRMIQFRDNTGLTEERKVPHNIPPMYLGDRVKSLQSLFPDFARQKG
jgi:hypothetical protein